MLVIKREQIQESTLQNYEHFIESKITINDSNSAELIQLGKQDSNEESVMLIGLILRSTAEFIKNPALETEIFIKILKVFLKFSDGSMSS